MKGAILLAGVLIVAAAGPTAVQYTEWPSEEDASPELAFERYGLRFRLCAYRNSLLVVNMDATPEEIADAAINVCLNQQLDALEELDPESVMGNFLTGVPAMLRESLVRDIAKASASGAPPAAD